MRNRLRSAVVALTAVSMALAWGCSTAQDRLGVAFETPGPTQFVAEDAGPDAEAGLISYCPTNKCPAGWTTCPSSRFPCDVNLLADVNNCGGCGLACPGGSGLETFSCVAGTCAMQCEATSMTLDCDGFADNGCEASRIHDGHCGVCGKTCSDPKKHCANQDGYDTSGAIDCGCPSNKTDCGGHCFDTKNDDFNCGECNTYCDPAGEGAPAVANAHYGCVNSECGAVKCNARFADCDGVNANGCETSLATDANCGGCGLACPTGQACHLDSAALQPRCMCPAGTTYCQSSCDGDACVGSCVDLTADTFNCGACGASCYGAASGAQRACSYGTCVMRCSDGRADCNNSQSDGCEVDTNSDPRNCGGCGHVCDAVAGQACVAGRCVVEPCSVDAGGLTR